jgi:hypothetical protein
MALQQTKNDVKTIVIGNHGSLYDLQKAISAGLDIFGPFNAIAKSCFFAFRGLIKSVFSIKNFVKENTGHGKIKKTIFDFFKKMNVSEKNALECYKMFIKVDINGDSKLSKNEICQICGYTKENVDKFFNNFDSNKDGFISPIEWSGFWIKYGVFINKNNELEISYLYNNNIIKERGNMHKTEWLYKKIMFKKECCFCGNSFNDIFISKNNNEIVYCNNCTSLYDNSNIIIGHKNYTKWVRMNKGAFCDTCKIHVTDAYHNDKTNECFCNLCVIMEDL